MKIQTTNISFNAGLTSAMKQEIKSTDVKKVSNELLKLGIDSDFKENKLIAWCSLQCINIIKEFNEKYNLKLGLPKGIFVEDFNNLKTSNKQSLGFCNLAPARLYLGKDIVTPEQTLFFNEFQELNSKSGNEFWDNIDVIADIDFDSKYSATDFFLDKILHEFMHVVHENNMLKQMSGKAFINTLQKVFAPQYLELFHKKYERLLSSYICKYAYQNPFEAVACDLSKKTIDCLDKNKLDLTNNFFENEPYKKNSFIESHIIYTPQKKIDTTLKNFWNGKFD